MGAGAAVSSKESVPEEQVRRSAGEQVGVAVRGGSGAAGSGETSGRPG